MFQPVPTNNKADIIVILAHYNDNERLKEAIKSINEPNPVDVLILDDGSTVKPNEEELQGLYGNKGILQIKYKPENIGASAIRNWGIEMILQTKYQYVGIMDSDDTNQPERFTKQINFLKNNPEIALIGSWGDYYDENRNFLFTLKHPTLDHEIRKKMHLNSTFLHSAITYRREVLTKVKGYSDKFKAGGEDYDFVFRVLKQFKVANYPESLVNITVTNNGLSSQKRFSQVLNRLKILVKNFYFGFYPIYGILRSTILLFVPRSFGITLRRIFKFDKLSI